MRAHYADHHQDSYPGDAMFVLVRRDQRGSISWQGASTCLPFERMAYPPEKGRVSGDEVRVTRSSRKEQPTRQAARISDRREPGMGVVLRGGEEAKCRGARKAEEPKRGQTRRWRRWGL